MCVQYKVALFDYRSFARKRKKKKNAQLIGFSLFLSLLLQKGKKKKEGIFNQGIFYLPQGGKRRKKNNERSRKGNTQDYYSFCVADTFAFLCVERKEKDTCENVNNHLQLLSFATPIYDCHKKTLRERRGAIQSVRDITLLYFPPLLSSSFLFVI